MTSASLFRALAVAGRKRPGPNEFITTKSELEAIAT
jgi:hypothetical protein